MHIHILGIAGTFMGGLAQIAKSLGNYVTGVDDNIYPPMKHQLDKEKIDYTQGYAPDQLPKKADIYVIGNTLSRGNACVEFILNHQYKYVSGAQFLSELVLKDKWVLAVSGTHGKTTTASLLAWILEYSQLNPSFLIGGVVNAFGVSARVTDSNFFVIEADEYDTAFFDKRSKFIHYHPKTLIINNLEYDHTDIFDSLEAIQTQFHHLIKILPSNGLVIYPKNNQIIQTVIDKGCWTKVQYSVLPQLRQTKTGSAFSVMEHQKIIGEVNWSLLGQHNMENGLHAILAADHIGIPMTTAIEAVNCFTGVKRRLEVIERIGNTVVYDDFAHHPTAIKTTLEGLRQQVGQNSQIIAIFELRSNTMKLGTLKDSLANSFIDANEVYCLKPTQPYWEIESWAKNANIKLLSSVDEIINQFTPLEIERHIVIMSNGSFDNIHQRILSYLKKR